METKSASIYCTIYFLLTGENLFSCSLCFSPEKEINFKTYHVQI